MNIYIYGNSDFKEEINNLLEHSNVKFRLDENSSIIQLDSIEQLKNAIEEEPEDIYLIDDSKIIKKKSINSKFKFLRPKDGIEQEYLLDHGIGDMSIDSLEELTTHIINKIEKSNKKSIIDDGVEESIRNIVDEAYEDEEEYEPLDDELSSLLTHIDPNEDEPMNDFFDQTPKMDDNDIATSSKDYFDEFINEEDRPMTYAEISAAKQSEENFESEDYKSDSSNDTDFSDLDEMMNMSDQLSHDDNHDDDFSDLDDLMNLPDEQLSNKSDNSEDFSDLDDLINMNNNDVNSEEKSYEDETPEEIKEELINALEEENATENDLSDLDELMKEQDPIDTQENNDIISKEKLEDIKENIAAKGEKMASEFSELDSLNENDVLSALEGLNDDIKPSTSLPDIEEIKPSTSSSDKESISLDSSNAQDIVALVQKLLNNKTLEITIKIKD
ncbi:hypothetical protein [Arcobacter sp. CECT 8985]|uniref:hypothetical protein n=1 Tax=Arcobacter sp. CECT 8985 TaxID=1935424 RepID=UPI00100B2C44|nr:hypothetical protein [Arcobacter sp. CECT 8985]RXJ87683.1 hypothetical protein CRU93_02490 [Arcobacter sp. CECT 8985]